MFMHQTLLLLMTTGPLQEGAVADQWQTVLALAQAGSDR